MTTHRDTCPMREGDSQRRWLVIFHGGPLDGLTAWLPRREWDVFAKWGKFTVMPKMYGIGSICRLHAYTVAGPHLAEHEEVLT